MDAKLFSIVGNCNAREVLMYYVIVYIIGGMYVWGIANTLSKMLNYLDVHNLVAIVYNLVAIYLDISSCD